MMDNGGKTAVYKIEQAIAQCETLSLLPAVVSRFLARLAGMELTPATLGELIESDPALTILALQICKKRGIAVKGNSWIQQMLSTVSLREIRDAVLSAKVYGGLDEDARTAFRKELTRHSLAAACCAERLARAASPVIDGQSAYLAGLLHDIGKFLLDEVMPKSFDVLLEEAKAEKTGFCIVERKNLGIDHAIIGKRFAQKLRLPAEVILGIWLHHNHSGALSEAVPQARIAGIVEAADCIVRRAGIGESGSFDEIRPDTIDAILPATGLSAVGSTDGETSPLGRTVEQIRQVEQELPDIVRQKCEAAGLTLLRPGWAYCEALRATTSQLADESAKLSQESVRLQSNASNFDFVRELLPDINSTMTALQVAEQFAVNWQRFFQTGPVCVYLVETDETKTVEAVIVENQQKTKTAVFDVPEDVVLIPQMPDDKFTLLDAGNYADWILEQSDVEFDAGRTKLSPLQSAGRTAGVIVFELRHPAEGDVSQRFAPAARLGAVLLDLFESMRSEQWLAERLATILQRLRTQDARPKTHDTIPRTEVIPETLAEMAAGAAHELNNPLSVISGRAQLLANVETDPEKKRILGQIQQNAEEISAIIDDLMSYARPSAPKPGETAVSQIIDEALDLAGLKTNLSRSDVKIEVSPDMKTVFVDSAQVACAISNIICNAVESYDGQAGPVTIQVRNEETKSSAAIEVSDGGRGMDAATLARAAQPFYSSRPAGRKRGMGLPHAQRLIELNGGTLTIASKPGKGTAVTVALPAKD